MNHFQRFCAGLEKEFVSSDNSGHIFSLAYPIKFEQQINNEDQSNRPRKKIIGERLLGACGLVRPVGALHDSIARDADDGDGRVPAAAAPQRGRRGHEPPADPALGAGLHILVLSMKTLRRAVTPQTRGDADPGPALEKGKAAGRATVSRV